MMNILVINCGSSSLKYQLFDMKNEEVLAKGLVERIGMEESRVKHTTIGKEQVVIEESIKDHKKAMELVVNSLVDENYGAIKSMDDIYAVGHRVVHGGEDFAESVIIDDKVMQALNDCIELAPLHNPPNIMGIEACRELMPNTPMVAVFDTAFHQTIPSENYIYALPYEYYEKYKIRRYGFHGTSHRYVSLKAAQMLDKHVEELNMITCHLGNGASVCAVKGGKSYATSMGFTPLAGLAMGTRCGDIDPAIVPYICEKENLSLDDINNVMNKKSGVLGISGVSSDFRDLEEAKEKGNKRAGLAIDVFCNRVKEFIGSYLAQLGHVDAIIFTAGIGENSASIREQVCEGLEGINIELDKDLNNVRGKDAIVSKDSSKIKILVVPTNEELMIARDTVEMINK